MIRKIIFIIILVILLIYGVRSILRPPTGISEDIEWGVGFSKPFAIDMGLDWEDTYLAILDELHPRFLRLPVYWQDIEPKPGEYFFADYDWMIKEAEKRNIKLILVVGRKLPRWPECHLPKWALSLDEKTQQEKIINLITEIIKHYKDLENLSGWQVENEPFLAFGECPKLDVEFLDREISLVRLLDSRHPIIVTDSGELSIWLRAAKRADIFGTTMYRIVYNRYTGYIEYPLPPKFFWLKANLVHLFYPKKPIIVSELQAEPWGPKLIYELDIEEFDRSMSQKQFYDNIAYAKKVGFPIVYLWGAEWWYWMKIKYSNDKYWQAAKELLARH